MKQINVNKPTDPVQLKILFPYIKLALDGIPAYGRQLYRNFQFPISDKTELLLEQSNSGYNLDTHIGLLGFLRDVEYMSSAKIDRFDRLGRERVLDSQGRLVTSAGVFHSNPDVITMYFCCSTLRISNRIFIEEDLDADYILDILEAPLYKRLLEADRIGHEKFLERVLQLIDSFYSSDIKFSARKNSKGVSGFDRMSRLMSGFNLASFKEFSLTGYFVEDACVFLTLFG